MRVSSLVSLLLFLMVFVALAERSSNNQQDGNGNLSIGGDTTKGNEGLPSGTHSDDFQQLQDSIVSDQVTDDGNDDEKLHNSTKNDNDESRVPAQGNEEVEEKNHDNHIHECNGHHHEHTESSVNHNAWNEAFIGTGIITLGGNAIILMFVHQDISKFALHTMVSFAAGGLLGDVFLHLLPHAMEHTHNEGMHQHDNSLGLSVLAGILVFFFIESCLSIYGDSHSVGHEHKATIHGIRPAALLNVVADFVHNSTDGMAIAAAYQTSNSFGNVMTLAILFHEIPHEIGDYAVLVSQGFSRWGAFRAQFISAIGAFAGCWFGLVFSASQPVLILGFTAGGFIYIALASILPDLLQQKQTFTSTICLVSAMIAGIFMMVLISDLEPH